MSTSERSGRSDFIRDIIDADLASGRHRHVVTRFPPEPNGYLHIGHAKSICLNFGIAQDYGGVCNLRYDDTNPTKEDVEYVHSIEADIRWLGFAPAQVLFASGYFEEMYQLAEKLVQDGKAYVCDLSDDDIKLYRGTLSEPGRPSPFRDRSVAENLDLLRRMRAGEFPDGARVLRAKIDMASANMKMRDPLLYRIRHAHHHRTGDAWCIYPMYDYAHPLSDAFEGITHSICTLEFENNRELYDWAIAATGAAPMAQLTGGKTPGDRPHQYEFARLNLDYTMMSKRKLLLLVQQGKVAGWDDPRMPTIAGMRRRGYSPEAIRAFCDMVGVAKANSVVDIGKLEFCVRDDLNQSAPRVMAVLRPVEVELTTFDGPALDLDAPFFPPDVGKPGSRSVPLTRTIYIERDDVQEVPEKGYLRLAPGRTVRLRYGVCITLDEIVKDANGEIARLKASHHPETAGGQAPADGRKVWGVIHWVSATASIPAEVRLYDRLFKTPRPDAGEIDETLNAESLVVFRGARLEPSLATAAPGSRWQFERLGYFCVDTVDGKAGAPVWNRIVTLRDAYAAGKDVAARDAAAKDVDEAPKKENARAKTRPKGRSPVEFRAEARVRDPELASRLERYQGLGLTADQADLLTGDRASGDLFEQATAAGASPGGAARWIINELPRELAGREIADANLDGGKLGALVKLVEDGRITGSAGKEVLAAVVATGADPAAIVKERGLDAVADTGALAALVDQILAANADKVAQYKGGKTGLLGFFVGQVVKASQGKASAQAAQALLTEKLA
jgi:glutaminyl-tRNA synthetase